MFTLRRWWDRHRNQTMLAGLALGTALLLRQTQGAALYEVYQVLSRPFQPGLDRQTIIKNAQMQELEQRLTELESQNQQLRSLLGAAAQTKPSPVTAPVVGRSSDHWWQHLILARGSADQVNVGDVVMAPGGVVGRVVQVTSNTSRVLLLSDPSSRTGVTISRSRNMGYIRGQSSNRVVMEFFDKVPDVRQGDVVTTSSLSQLFPAGLPIGRVESVDLNRSPAPEAVIELSAPISSLEWAMIYSHSSNQPPLLRMPQPPADLNLPPQPSNSASPSPSPDASSQPLESIDPPQ
jgi:rod shape-determining protein MreC